MPVLRQTKSESGWSQAKQRLVGLFHDQHRSAQFPDGRPWWGILERPALQDAGIDTAPLPMPIGDLSPDGWDAPWFPEQKYFRYAQGSVMQEFKLRIDYRAMQVDYTAATRGYYERAVKEAAALKMFPLPTYNSVIPWELQQVVGRAPRSPKIPEAALAGDVWLLFGQGEENEVLARLLQMDTEWVPTPEQSMRKGDEMSELRQELARLRELIAEQKAKPKGKGASPEQMAAMRAKRYAKLHPEAKEKSA